MQNTIPVPNNNSMPFDDREMLNDALISQKQLTSDYNDHVNESATPEVLNEFMAILNEEHQIQHDVFLEMQKRGWYQTTPAEQTKINETKNKFSGQQQ